MTRNERESIESIINEMEYTIEQLNDTEDIYYAEYSKKEKQLHKSILIDIIGKLEEVL